MDVISILQKKRQEITGFEVRIDVEQADAHPHVFTRIAVTYVVTGHEVDPEAVSRAIELSKDRYCPASAMLEKAVAIEHHYEIVPAAG
jgi:putative redox protein